MFETHDISQTQSSIECYLVVFFQFPIEHLTGILHLVPLASLGLHYLKSNV